MGAPSCGHAALQVVPGGRQHAVHSLRSPGKAPADVMDVSELPCASLSDAISELLRQVARSEVLSTEDGSFRSERRRQ